MNDDADERSEERRIRNALDVAPVPPRMAAWRTAPVAEHRRAFPSVPFGGALGAGLLAAAAVSVVIIGSIAVTSRHGTPAPSPGQASRVPASPFVTQTPTAQPTLPPSPSPIAAWSGTDTFEQDSPGAPPAGWYTFFPGHWVVKPGGLPDGHQMLTLSDTLEGKYPYVLAHTASTVSGDRTASVSVALGPSATAQAAIAWGNVGCSLGNGKMYLTNSTAGFGYKVLGSAVVPVVADLAHWYHLTLTTRGGTVTCAMSGGPSLTGNFAVAANDLSLSGLGPAAFDDVSGH